MARYPLCSPLIGRDPLSSGTMSAGKDLVSSAAQGKYRQEAKRGKNGFMKSDQASSLTAFSWSSVCYANGSC